MNLGVRAVFAFGRQVDRNEKAFRGAVHDTVNRRKQQFREYTVHPPVACDVCAVITRVFFWAGVACGVLGGGAAASFVWWVV